MGNFIENFNLGKRVLPPPPRVSGHIEYCPLKVKIKYDVNKAKCKKIKLCWVVG